LPGGRLARQRGGRGRPRNMAEQLRRDHGWMHRTTTHTARGHQATRRSPARRSPSAAPARASGRGEQGPDATRARLLAAQLRRSTRPPRVGSRVATQADRADRHRSPHRRGGALHAHRSRPPRSTRLEPEARFLTIHRPHVDHRVRHPVAFESVGHGDTRADRRPLKYRRRAHTAAQCCHPPERWVGARRVGRLGGAKPVGVTVMTVGSIVGRRGKQPAWALSVTGAGRSPKVTYRAQAPVPLPTWRVTRPRAC
jgi:hypothetical protein